ncbi:hypothetical protein SK128_000732 [Halocaridina rubra]|uniref:Lipocalin/cytosolic fatty-acid binding domain-containing protein n=1 Tax=Halocaridina rubra TaxID=373956 RepID=A0AAN9A616_HALRR
MDHATLSLQFQSDYMNVATRGLTSEGKKVRQSAVMRVEIESVQEPNPAHMTVDAAGVPAAPYQIISSDYRTYSCVYSCLEYFGFRAEFFWIFGRTPTLPAEKIKLCHETLENLGVNYEKMVPIVQGEPCPYYAKLDQMLSESEEHLLKVLGPNVSTSSSSENIPITTVATTTKEEQIIEEEIKEIKEIVQEEKKVIQELEIKMAQTPSDNLYKETAKVSQKPKEIDQDEDNSAPTLSPAMLLLFPMLVSALLGY